MTGTDAGGYGASRAPSALRSSATPLVVHGDSRPHTAGGYRLAKDRYTPGFRASLLLHVPIGIAYMRALHEDGPIEHADWRKAGLYNMRSLPLASAAPTSCCATRAAPTGSPPSRSAATRAAARQPRAQRIATTPPGDSSFRPACENQRPASAALGRASKAQPWTRREPAAPGAASLVDVAQAVALRSSVVRPTLSVGRRRGRERATSHEDQARRNGRSFLPLSSNCCIAATTGPDIPA